MKWVVLFFCLITAGVSMADTCVIEGAWVMPTAGSPQQCCQGLELNPAAQNSGTKGQCLKKENGQFCIGQNLPILHYPGAVDKCCSGLGRVLPNNPDPRVSFLCMKEATCVKEGEWASVSPGAPDCCQGLVRYSPPGKYGAVQCVKEQATNCIQENLPLFQYPGAPKCCEGLHAGRPSMMNPVGFADVCLRGVVGADKPAVNNSEQHKQIDIDPGVHLTEDPGSSRQ
ncbi:MAG: hypothetical protein ACJ76H_10150 [Bacteriovoracaceae bacterium]